MTLVRSPKRQALTAALATGLCIATAPAASADSIAFLRDGDAYLATTDGSREVRLTAGNQFNGITQADDGTIYAVERGVVFAFDGRSRDTAPPVGIIPMGDPDVSADGTKLAYHYFVSSGPRYTVKNVDGSSAGWDDQNGVYTSWITNDLILKSNGAGYIGTSHAGLGGWQNWFSTPDGRKHDNAITRATDRLVVVVRDYDDTGPWSVAHYSNSSAPPRDGGLDAPPPDQQPTLRCQQGFGSTEPRDPSFSPDGTRIAWEMPDGVHVQPVYDLNSCSQPGGGFVIPGAKQPDWGPADVPPPIEDTQIPDTDTGTTIPDAGTNAGPLASVKAPKRGKIKTALKKGLRVKVTCSSPCKVSGDLRYKRKVVAKGKKSVSSKGTVVLKFTAKGKKQLRRLKKAKLAMKLKATDSQKRTSTKSGSVTLKR